MATPSASVIVARNHPVALGDESAVFLANSAFGSTGFGRDGAALRLAISIASAYASNKLLAGSVTEVLRPVTRSGALVTSIAGVACVVDGVAGVASVVDGVASVTSVIAGVASIAANKSATSLAVSFGDGNGRTDTGAVFFGAACRTAIGIAKAFTSDELLAVPCTDVFQLGRVKCGVSRHGH